MRFSILRLLHLWPPFGDSGGVIPPTPPEPDETTSGGGGSPGYIIWEKWHGLDTTKERLRKRRKQAIEIVSVLMMRD